MERREGGAEHREGGAERREGGEGLRLYIVKQLGKRVARRGEKKWRRKSCGRGWSIWREELSAQKES